MRAASEEQFQRLFDAANKILEAAYADEQAAQRAITQLERSRELMERRIQDLQRSVVHTVEQSASVTASQAATLLQEKFKEADQAAEMASQRYARASRSLGLRLFGFTLLAQLIALASVWWLLQRTIPPYSEIVARRAEVQQLERRVEELERRGGRLEFATCADPYQKKSRLCVRTDEGRVERAFQSEGDERTFRIVWGH